MFEQLRTDRVADLVTAANALASAQQGLQQLRDQIAAQQRHKAAADGALNQAAVNMQQGNANRDVAQGVVNQRQSATDAAAGVLAVATRDRDVLADREPENPLSSGKPNPKHGTWLEQITQANERINAAQTTLNQATAQLIQAAQARDAAASTASALAAASASAQAEVNAAVQSLQLAQQTLSNAEVGLRGRQQAVAVAEAQLAAIDTRVARLVAQPLDRTDLEAAAEIEIAALSAQRQARHDHLLRRAAHTADQAALLGAEDEDISGLVPVRDAVTGWPSVSLYPSLGSASAALDAVIVAAQTQQGRPTSQRTDDLGNVQSNLSQAFAAVQTAVGQAMTERDQRAKTLDNAAAALAKHQERQP